MSGLILLVLIGILVAYGYTRLRGKMKLSVSRKNWLGALILVVLVGLIMWATHTSH